MSENKAKIVANSRLLARYSKLPLLLIHREVMYAGFAGAKPVTHLT